MAIADPATLKEVAKRGHTIGSHTWSHKKFTMVSAASATYEFELGLSAVTKALGAPVAPFFRYPYLAHTKASHTHLAGRGIGTFGIDVDSRDFRTRSPGTVLRNVMSQLEHEKKGILLFHDIQPSTAGALASLLAELKARGYKVVHMVAKTPATTLPEFDAIAEKALKAKGNRRGVRPAGDAGRDLAGLGGRGQRRSRGGACWPQQRRGAGSHARERATVARGARRARPTGTTCPSDPWQLKSFGTAGGP